MRPVSPFKPQVDYLTNTATNTPANTSPKEPDNNDINGTPPLDIAPAQNTCLVDLQPIHEENPLTYTGHVCSKPSYVFKNCDEKVFKTLLYLSENAAKNEQRSSKDWPGVIFNHETRTMEIHLDPIAAERFLRLIGAGTVLKRKEMQNGRQESMFQKYASTLSRMAHAWRETTSHLVAENRHITVSTDNTSDDKVKNMKSMFSQLIYQLLKQGSFCIAEGNHLNNHGLLNFLNKNMKTLKEKGVKTIYTEYLTIEICKQFAKEDGSLDFEKASASDIFKEYILSWPYGHKALEVFKTAHENGVRIVGVDSRACFPLAIDDDSDDDSDNETESEILRQASMNLAAALAIMNDPGFKELFIIWAGEGHLRKCDGSHDPNIVRGINMPLNLPSITFASVNKKEESAVVLKSDDTPIPPPPPDMARNPFLATIWKRFSCDAWVVSTGNEDMTLLPEKKPE